MFGILHERPNLTNLEIKVWLGALDAVERRIEMKHLDKRDSQTFTSRSRNVEE